MMLIDHGTETIQQQTVSIVEQKTRGDAHGVEYVDVFIYLLQGRQTPVTVHAVTFPRVCVYE